MSTRRWLGRAATATHVSTHTVGGTAANGQVYSVTINGITVSYTATGVDTNNTIAAALQALLAASTVTEFLELTWTVGTNVITATATAAAREQVITTSATGTGTFVTATTTSASGPNRWDVAANWSGSAVPVTGDDVIIDLPVSITSGLDQSSVTLASLTISAAFAKPAVIGRPRTNASGYPEFRDDYLKISATTVKIGVGDGIGSGRIKLDLGTAQSTIEIRKSASPEEQNIPALLLKGTHASNALDVQSGSVGVAAFGGESATLASLRTAAGSVVLCGEGCSVTTLQGEGTVQLNATVTTLTQRGGNWTVNGASNVTTLTQSAGVLNYRGSGTIATSTVGGLLDFSGDASARTMTDTTLKAGGRIMDPQDTVTFTNGIQLDSAVRMVAAS